MIAVALASANSSDGRQERQADRDLILPTSAGAMIRAQLMSEVRAKDRQKVFPRSISSPWWQALSDYCSSASPWS